MLEVFTFGEQIKEARLRMGLSQTALARILNIKKSAVSKWECFGVQSPRPETRKRIIDLCKLHNINFRFRF
jgi:transcriptional regulator with XRE-family HTH domain